MLFVQGMLVGAYNIFLEEITNRDYLWGDGLGVMGRRILRVGWAVTVETGSRKKKRVCNSPREM